jgi:cellulose synthase/poly-beta-1,6-N-acetylglucosamine synthase-like glycosyltransferase
MVGVEIILIDNASTDDTKQVAESFVPLFEKRKISLHVVVESKSGLMHARKRGVKESRYEYICFVDDDNWLAEDYLQGVVHILANNPDVGAVGGTNLIQVTDHAEVPDWFLTYQQAYAVGKQAKQDDDVTDLRGFVWGAGLGTRKHALEKVLFEERFWLVGRREYRLSAGDDSELCFKMRRYGWRIWYSSSLCLQHHMPQQRLRWQYFLQMQEGFGAASVFLGLYQKSWRGELKSSWWQEVRQALWPLFRSHWYTVTQGLRTDRPGDGMAVATRFNLGKARALLTMRREYLDLWKELADPSPRVHSDLSNHTNDLK